jgi:hypothetical protein
MDVSGCSCPGAQILIPSPAEDFNMDHRLFAVLAIVCFALEGAGCMSESQRARREEVLMPLQTGSTLRRRVMTDDRSVTKKPKKKKDSKRNSPKPPAPAPSPQRPEDESTTPPDRFR